MMDEDKKSDCFGILEKVFPMTENGLRQTPEDCFYHCPVKTKCLQQAMATKEGIQVQEEMIKRMDQSGGMNFFERWSRKKQAHRKLARNMLLKQ